MSGAARTLRWLAIGGLALACPLLAYQQNFAWLYLLEHAGTNAALCLMFGRTLRSGQTPLCTRLSAMAHGSLSPSRKRYTHQVTIAWTVFFAVMTVASALLFFLAPIEAWLGFASFATPLLVVLMFACEYLLRLRVLPREKHSTLIETARTFWKAQLSSTDPSC